MIELIEVFFIVCILELVIQIISIIQLKRTNDSLYWNIFIGITISSLISSFLVCGRIIFNDLTNAYILFLLIFGLLTYGCKIIVDVILIVIGLVIKDKLKDSVKLNKYSIIIGLLVIAINLIICHWLTQWVRLSLTIELLTYCSNFKIL